MKFLVIYSLICTVVSSAKLPSFLQKCSLKDQICLKGAVQDALSKLKGGLPDWSVPTLDPLFIPKMSIGAGENIVQLTQNYENAHLYGTSDSKITDFEDIHARNIKVITTNGRNDIQSVSDLLGPPQYHLSISDEKDHVFIPPSSMCEGGGLLLSYGEELFQPDHRIHLFDLDHVVIGFTFPEWVFNATYEVGGKILLLPVTGKGLCSLAIENGKGTLNFKMETYKKKNKMFMRGIEGKLEIIPQKVTFQFDNLFNGNKELGDNINKVLNENWKDVYDEVQHGYGEVYSTSFMNIMNRMLSHLPVSEIFLDAMK